MSATHRTRSSRRPTERDGKAFWDAAQFDHHLTSSSGAYIASQPLCPREPSMGTFCPGKGGRRRESEVGPVPRCIGDARVVCTPVGRIDGSSLSRAEGLNQRQVGGGARSPGAALLSRCHSIDTVRAEDRGGNCGCWLHRPRVSSHRFLCAAHAPPVPGQPDNGACHLVGEKSPDQRSGQFSRASPPEGEHSPREEPCAGWQAEWREQTR